MDTGDKEVSIQPLETIKAREGLLKAARGFRWLNPEENELGEPKTNLEVIKESIKILQDCGLVSNLTEEMEWVEQIREQANAIYKKIYPSKLDEEERTLEAPYYHGIEPHYHGIGTKDDWHGHNDFVIAAAARSFSSLVKLKKSANKEELDKLNEFFGPGWQEQELTLADFRTLIAMAAFHEAGEWWIKAFWKNSLKQQQEQFDSQVKAEKPIEQIEVDLLQDIIKNQPAEERSRNIEQMQEVIEKVKKAVAEFGLSVAYDSEEEASAFYLYFKGGERKDVDFAPKELLEPSGKKTFLLAALFRAADFSQCFSPEYLKEVIYRPDEAEPERSRPLKKIKGPLVLYNDFYSFKPGALPTFKWLKPEDTGVSWHFFDSFLKPNVDNEYVWLILDQAFGSKENNPYYQAARELEKNVNQTEA